MNFGQNLYQWFLSNAQSLVLMAIVVIGIYLGFKREFSKLIGFLVVALIAVADYPLKYSIYQHFQGNKLINLLLIYYQRMSLDTQVFLDMQRYGTAHQY